MRNWRPREVALFCRSSLSSKGAGQQRILTATPHAGPLLPGLQEGWPRGRLAPPGEFVWGEGRNEGRAGEQRRACPGPSLKEVQVFAAGGLSVLLVHLQACQLCQCIFQATSFLSRVHRLLQFRQTPFLRSFCPHVLTAGFSFVLSCLCRLGFQPGAQF